MLDAHLLEENIRAVEHLGRVPSRRALLGQEVLELLALYSLAIRVHLRYFAQEGRLRNVRLTQESIDLLAHFIARLPDIDIPILFSRELDTRNIELFNFFVFLHFLLLRLDACLPAVFEEAKSCFIHLISISAHGTLELHEAAVGVAVHANCALELGYFHFAAVDEGVDLATDGVAAICNCLIVAVEVDGGVRALVAD